MKVNSGFYLLYIKNGRNIFMKKEIMEIVRKTIELEDSVTDETLASSDLMVLGMNSIMAIQIIVLLESEFNIEFDDEDLLLENVDSIEKIVNLVKKYLKRKEVN